MATDLPSLAPAPAAAHARADPVEVEVEAEPPESCPACNDAPPRRRTKREQWVQCDNCTEWYHWVCVRPNPLDSLDAIDKWYCPPCINATVNSPHPLYILAKAPSRKSSRAAPKLDYANLDAHLPADPGKWLRHLERRKATEGAFRCVPVEELTEEWLAGPQGMQEPFWVEKPDGLGMKMPHADMTVGEVAEVVGPQTQVEVIDVASQQSTKMTLADWAVYYADPHRDKVKNVISLEVSESPLAAQVEAPALVRQLDWVEQIWPKDLKKPDTYPRVQKYCLMSVENCWTDWHVDFAGSSVYYHILRGGKVFYFIRPTPANLAAYAEWSGDGDRQENTWLGDHVDEVFKIELKTGNTMIIPTGWIHAVFTPIDTLVFGGNFLHSLDIERQLAVYQIELATKVPRKFRFPHFVRLLWYVAAHYAAILRASPPTTLPPERVLTGLAALSTFLIDQAARLPKSAPGSAERRRVAKDNVPTRVRDPASLSRELRLLVFTALQRPLDEFCVLPPPVAPSPARSHKRKASDGTEPPKKILVPKRDDPATIIATRTVPTTVSETREQREDPLDLASGAREAEVRESRSTQQVVRRSVGEDGTVTVETRTVVTTIERVRLPPADAKPPEPTYSYPHSTISTATPLPSFGPPYPVYPVDPADDILGAIGRSLPPPDAPPDAPGIVRRASNLHSLLDTESDMHAYDGFEEPDFGGGAR